MPQCRINFNVAQRREEGACLRHLAEKPPLPRANSVVKAAGNITIERESSCLLQTGGLAWYTVATFSPSDRRESS